MSAIKTIDLTKTYHNQDVVHQLNIDVPNGCVYGFIGKNGAGKTTTISMLVGLKEATNGEIEILGEKISFSNSEYKHNIGFVSDVPEFYTWMNASEYLIFCGSLFRISTNVLKERIPSLLKFVGLENTKKPIRTYSRGMKQRLGIAQALIHEPKIIILDEPTSALDPIGRKDIMDIILKLKGNVTVFYSTHILSDVERVCDMVGIIDHGNLLVQDTIENLKMKYYETSYFLEFKNINKNVIESISNLSSISSVIEHEHGLIVKVRDENLYHTEIIKLIYEQNWTLLDYHPIEQSLEDIFLKVVNKEC